MAARTLVGGAVPAGAAAEGLPYPGAGWRCQQGEIDIVAKRGGTVAIVEVKARSTLDAANSALSPRQRQRLERAAATFVARHPALTGLPIRFDMMLVTPGRWPSHLVDAWREGSALSRPLLRTSHKAFAA